MRVGTQQTILIMVLVLVAKNTIKIIDSQKKNGRMNNARAHYNHNRTEMVRGMTGNHRSGMVDENGILNRKTDHIQRGMNFKNPTMHKKKPQNNP